MNDRRFDTMEFSFCTVHIEDFSSNISSFLLLLDQIKLFKKGMFRIYMGPCDECVEGGVNSNQHKEVFKLPKLNQVALISEVDS
jgi:hypothetical protein